MSIGFFGRYMLVAIVLGMVFSVVPATLINVTNPPGTERFTESAISSIKAGLLDPSFGDNGIVLIKSNQRIQLGHLDFDAQNRILIAVGGDDTLITQFTAIRLRNDGSFDPTFGTGGYAQLSFKEGTAISILSLTNGSILVAGNFDILNEHNILMKYCVITRFTYDGQVDASFGNNGALIITTTRQSQMNPLGITLDAQGNIYLVGQINYLVDDHSSIEYDSYAFITKMSFDGVLDKTFGTKGLLITAYALVNNALIGVGIDNYNRVVVGGISNSAIAGIQSFVLARYLPQGVLDITFGKHGVVKTNIGQGVPLTIAPQGVYALQIDPLQRILVNGIGGNDVQAFFIGARYFQSGQLDTRFAEHGFIKNSFGKPQSLGLEVKIDVRNKIYFMGVSGGSFVEPFYLSVARYLDDGTIDTTFGAANTGSVSTLMADPINTFFDNGFCGGIDGNGRVVMGTVVRVPAVGPVPEYFLLKLVRYTSDYGLLFTS